MRGSLRTLTIATVLTVVFCGGVSAENTSDEETKLAEAAQNPLANMTVLPLQFNWNTGAGPYDRMAFNLNVQPVVPFRGNEWNIIARAIIPIVSMPKGET